MHLLNTYYVLESPIAQQKTKIEIINKIWNFA